MSQQLTDTLPFFQTSTYPPAEAAARQLAAVTMRKARCGMASNYASKDELLRNQLSIIIDEAAHLPTNAAERITGLFLSLLEIEFLMTEELREPLLRSARDYAVHLAVHVNPSTPRQRK